MNRRTFLKFAAGAAGLLLPEHVAAEPERRMWALDRTMIPERPFTSGSLVTEWVDMGELSFAKEFTHVVIDGQEYPVAGPPHSVQVAPGRVFINGLEVEVRGATRVITAADLDLPVSDFWERVVLAPNSWPE